MGRNRVKILKTMGEVSICKNSKTITIITTKIFSKTSISMSMKSRRTCFYLLRRVHNRKIKVMKNEHMVKFKASKIGFGQAM
jgi:hypothetical protein